MKSLLVYVMLFCGIMMPAYADEWEDLHSEDYRAPDGYIFNKKTFTRYELQLKIVVVRDAIDLQKAYDRIYPKIPWKKKALLKGFAVLNEGTKTCEIYIVDPQVQYEPQYLGHELVHCMYGFFHKE